MRLSGGIATAAVMMTGMAVVQPAYARQTVNVPCGAGALVVAVTAANTNGGTLLLASNCNYALTGPMATGRGPDGLLITGNVHIIGGHSTSITRSSSAATTFRIIEVASGASLVLRNILVSGGVANPAMPTTDDTGGGILNSRGTLHLIQSTISGNSADSGGGLSNDSGRVIVFRSRIENNATSTGGDGGGGLYNDGHLTIEHSLVRANHANTNGGGIYNRHGGRLETFRVTLDRNTATGNGGALYDNSDGRAVLQRTLVQQNSAANGGGIFNGGVGSRVTPIRSLVRNNTPNNCAPTGSVRGCTGES